MPAHLHVVTGGPGAGKTSLLEAAAAAGIATWPEAGRAIIRAQQAIGGPARPDVDPLAFAELMLSWDMRSLLDARQAGTAALFDRGIPDSIGYLHLVGVPVPAHFLAAAQEFRYAGTVFAAPPWREIYENDAERSQDFAEAEATFRAVTAAYRAVGYDVAELPLAPVHERLRFLRDRLAR